MFQERNQAGGHGYELFGRDVHVIDASRLNVDEVSFGAAGDGLGREVTFVVDRRIGLGDDVECVRAVLKRE